MQFLKDEVKNNITAAAVAEFYDKGFKNASLRRIAANSGITAGNIYRYFKDKTSLFDEIIAPVSQQVLDMLYEERYTDIARGHFQDIDAIMEKTMLLCRAHVTEIYILIFKSEGSRFENLRQSFTELIARRIRDASPGGKTPGDLTADVLAAAFVEGLFSILAQSRDDYTAIEDQIRKLIVFFFAERH
ncbi:transcriptional regulator, TetR family [Sporobacter termitidis DSM 10068]|uniref:Transcriptional regulator, TetR family n=1 Tax=Sporobacter termitidis DSM 10068 TaxID=1123282 RepID=A0A1M5WF93_9FIRM|nr:TetR/AcrR family transcriptional regulator [Sporobacter termitidis]SHH86162.1 transcriptional regulator, TetR family [Sporobacter termitidis DSM 10068]